MEDVDGGAGEGDFWGEGDGEGITAGGMDADWGGGADEVQVCGDGGGGDGAGTAGEGFGFDAALIGTDIEEVIADDADEVGVGAMGVEVWGMADGGAEFVDFEVAEVFVEEADSVWDAGIDGVEGEVIAMPTEGEAGTEVVWGWHLDTDLVIMGEDFGEVEACGSFDTHGSGCDTEFAGEACDAAHTVSAHSGGVTIWVEEEHTEMGVALGLTDQDEAIGSDAEDAVADSGDEGWVMDGPDLVTVVGEDEIVTGAVHFPEGEIHGAVWWWGQPMAAVIFAMRSGIEIRSWRIESRSRRVTV